MNDASTDRTVISPGTITLASVLLVAFILIGWAVTNSIQSTWKTNEGNAISAPQESVAAEMAIKDAQLWTIGTLAVVAGELVAISTLLFGAARSLAARPNRGATKQCPFCAEPVLAAAKLCRYCRSDVSTVEASPTAVLPNIAGPPGSPIGDGTF